MDSKKVLSALLIAIFLAGMTNALASSSSSTPSTSHVAMEFNLLSGGKQVGFVTNPVVYINATNGKFTTMETVNNVNVSLLYGNYQVTIMPSTTTVAGVQYLTNKDTVSISVEKQYQTEVVNIPAIKEAYSTVKLVNTHGENANLQFTTLEGYNFYSKTTNSSSFKAFLPTGVDFFVKSYFNNNPSAGETVQQVTLTSLNTLSITLGSSVENYYGTVYNKASGSKITSFNVISINTTSPMHYTSAHFSSGIFSVSAPNGTVFYVAADGYLPHNITKNGTLNLVGSTSNVKTTYSISKNLRNIGVETYYNITGTAFPEIKNSTVMNLYYQEQLDGSSFSKEVKNYATTVPANTYYSFLANNAYYKMNGTVNSHMSYTSKYVRVSTFVNYTNLNMTSKGYKNLVLNVFENGIIHTPASVAHSTYISYVNSTVSVKSASSAITYGNPFEILPVKSNSWVTVQFGKVQSPYFVTSNLAVYYKGILTTDSILNSSSKNPIIVAPANTNFSINASKALYNPILGQYEYLAPTTFTWSLNGSSLKGYNQTFNFSKTTTITLTGKDASGFTNTTNITVITLAKSQMPSVNLTYSYGSVSHNVNYTKTSTGKINIRVPQNSIVTFDAAASSLNLTYNSHKYSVSLYYIWNFPNSTTSGSLVTHRFTSPSIKIGNVSSFLNVTSAGNSTSVIQILAYVNDTTAPSSVLTLQNSNDKNITSLPAGTPVILTGNYSSTKYFTNSQLTYNWSFKYANGTEILENSSALTVLAYNTSLSSWNMSSWLKVELNIVTTVHISLKVSNTVLSSYDNISKTPTYSGPKLIVTGVDYTGTFSQGVTKEVEVNVTNSGSATASGITINVYDGTTLVIAKSFTASLSVNQTQSFYVNVSLSNSGSQTLSFQAGSSVQPNFVQKDGALTKTVSVGVSSDRVLLVVVAIIVIILILALLYYRITQGRLPMVGKSRSSSLPSNPSQKRITDQKQQPPRKDGNTKQ